MNRAKRTVKHYPRQVGSCYDCRIQEVVFVFDSVTVLGSRGSIKRRVLSLSRSVADLLRSEPRQTLLGRASLEVRTFVSPRQY